MARKLEAQFDGQYLMSSVLMTSTMKSEPGTPPIREPDNSFGVPVSAAATCIVGGSADGRGAGAALGDVADVAPFATGGVTAVAAPATATLARNLRRLTSGRGSLRFMEFSLDCRFRQSRWGTTGMTARRELDPRILSLPRHGGKASARVL